MNKDEYLRRLKNRLNDLNIDGKDEIYNDFTNHFEIGHQNGLSDEELIDNLGSIDEVLESYESLSRQEKITVDHHNQPKEFTNKITHVNVQARHANTTLKHSNDNGFHVDLYKDGKLPEKYQHQENLKGISWSDISKILYQYAKNADVNNRGAWLAKQFAEHIGNF